LQGNLTRKIVDLVEKTLRPDWKKGQIGKSKEKLLLKRNRATVLKLTVHGIKAL